MISYLLDKNFQNNYLFFITFKVESFISTNYSKKINTKILSRKESCYFIRNLFIFNNI